MEYKVENLPKKIKYTVKYNKNLIARNNSMKLKVTTTWIHTSESGIFPN